MPGNKPSIFIDGEAGATGVAIRTLLEPRLDVLLKSLPADLRKNPSARRDMMAEVDVVVLCLPDDAAREAAVMADELGSDSPKVLDASTAHQLDHDWTYGFPEMTEWSGRTDRRRTQGGEPRMLPDRRDCAVAPARHGRADPA